MFLSDRIWRAIERGAEWHGEQKRRVSGLPYFVHPYAVGFLLAHFTDNEDVVIAGLLHDVLEDVSGMTAEKLEKEFGQEVARLVEEVTEDRSIRITGLAFTRTSRWRAIKEEYLRRLSDDSEGALMIVAADKICNIRSLMDDYPKHGGDFWKMYGRTKEEYTWLVQAQNDTIQARLKHPLADELDQMTKAVLQAIEEK